ncbi:HEAT repeat domain-containing protein [Leptolyngbya sp. GGD]|uniref:HEAT repeat domain-containing protein n=1 Tax=Leptolyngbya sp. GGD TaxID=2997907 RepID=UPI00227A892E|nr:HEAT repeat domain-containing protein [Leptolyngbya sp. GGD]MCY6489879.1 HEAT repeat domain-containing protein [Leptolyngbya sp. GGD]
MSLDFQSYLKKSIEDASRKQQSFYVSTDAVERPQLRLMAQKVPEKQQDGRPEEKVNPVPVLEGIRDFCAAHKHVVLVGRPGSGKSTALNQLLIEEATRSIENSSLPIPVLVPLKSDQSILKLIQRALWRGRLRLDETAIEDLLFEGRLLLLLDGINEIPRQELQRELQEFREDNLDVSMIFTTRDLASGGYLGIEKQLEMQPLTPFQLREFVGESFPEQTEEFLKQLSDRLKELGKTPLLLEMLCEVFRRTGKIPENLGLVFREFTQHYERNLKEGVRIESDRELWKLVLRQLAWVMMHKGEPTEFRGEIEREEAVEAIGQFLNEQFPYLEARKCLRDLENYHLIQVGTNQEELEFRHQLIQEYYAAEALLAQLEEFDLEDGEQFKQEFLNFLKWTEPVALMLAFADEVRGERLVKLALRVDLLLGARLAGEVKTEFQDKTIAALNQHTQKEQLSEYLRLELLGQTKSSSVLSELQEASSHREFLIREIAAEALGHLAIQESVPILIKLIDDQDDCVRISAVRSLGMIGDPKALIHLIERLADKNTSVNLEAVEALIKLNNPDEVTSRLLELIHDKHKEYFVRQMAAFALAGLQTPEALSHLIDLLKSKNTCIRRIAIQASERCQDKRIVEELCVQLSDSRFYRMIVKTLDRISSPESIFVLSSYLKSENQEFRYLAACSLGRLGQQEAIPELLEILRNKHYRFMNDAIYGLGACRVEEAVPMLKEILLTIQNNASSIAQSGYVSRSTIASTLGKIKGSLSVQDLIDALNKNDSDLFGAIATVLATHNDRASVPVLQTALQNRNSEFQENASYALALMGYTGGVSILMKLLERGRNLARWWTAEALTKANHPEILKRLWEFNCSGKVYVSETIQAIQKNCKYYNHEIYQAYLEAQKDDRQTPQNSDRSNITYDLRGATIGNLAHEVQGNQITQPEEPQ